MNDPANRTPEDNRREPVSAELKRLQQPGQDSIRRALRIGGVVSLLVGLLCFGIAALSLFSGFGGGPRRLFFLGFIGLPLMFVGGVLCQFGFLGAVARFMAGETAPVATDAVKYVAEETKGAVETISEAAAKGVVEGMDAARVKPGSDTPGAGRE